jgi:enoyl-[acyl-carrier protein] reductase/trans-2-enoyl-CoA reductase (NAD+)
VAYSYIGTEITWPMYWHGTLGQAKQHLDNTAKQLVAEHKAEHLDAYVGVMKSVVTQASAAIPVLPLYIAISFRVMKDLGIHEGTIEQINRMFRDRLYRKDHGATETDSDGRLRLDDWELREDVQQACKSLWSTVNTENLNQLTDYAGYKNDFLRLFGFGRTDINYEEDVNPDRRFDVIEL